MNLVQRDITSPFETKSSFRVARQGLPCRSGRFELNSALPSSTVSNGVLLSCFINRNDTLI